MAGATVAAMAKVGHFAPVGVRLAARETEQLAEFIAGGSGRLLAITGAGCSTESGVPDYRSPQGSYSKGHKPMLHAEFVGSSLLRARYWARSLRGWRYFAGARPNNTHLSLAALGRAGYVDGVITQNVDGLHTKAGSANVIDLHGRNDVVECLSCSARRPRMEYQEELEVVNAAWMLENLPPLGDDDDIRADGDAHLLRDDFRGFRVPSCSKCGGILKPNVVFFGGFLLPEVKAAAIETVEKSSRLLILGSSCQVYSAFSLVKSAHKAGKPVAMVNIGETRVDPLIPPSLKFEARCGEALPRVCEHLGVDVSAIE